MRALSQPFVFPPQQSNRLLGTLKTNVSSLSQNVVRFLTSLITCLSLPLLVTEGSCGTWRVLGNKCQCITYIQFCKIVFMKLGFSLTISFSAMVRIPRSYQSPWIQEISPDFCLSGYAGRLLILRVL